MIKFFNFASINFIFFSSTPSRGMEGTGSGSVQLMKHPDLRGPNSNES